jgi:hypothetical protein
MKKDEFIINTKDCSFCVLCSKKGKSPKDIDHMEICKERQKEIESCDVNESIQRLKIGLSHCKKEKTTVSQSHNQPKR